MTRKKAIRLAVDALERRRRKFSVGYHAYKDGFCSVWAERDFKKYVELSDAINKLATE